MTPVDSVLVLVAAASLPVYGTGIVLMWRQWHRWHDDRARREFISALLWFMVAATAFAVVLTARFFGLGLYDPVRVASLGGLFGVLFASGLVLLVEWHDR